MAEKVRLLLKTVSDKTNRYHLFNNVRVRMNNTTIKAQEKLNNIQNTVSAKYDIVTKQIHKDLTALQTQNAVAVEPSVIPKKITKWWQWYQQLTGLDKIDMAKHKVVMAQEALFKCQNQRRNINNQASIIINNLKEVYSELIQTRRDDPKYVQLVTKENKYLQDQLRFTMELEILDKEEKESFVLLTTAINEYYDSQILNTQKIKYLSILTSALIAILSLIWTILNNMRRSSNIDNIILKHQQENTGLFQNFLNKIENENVIRNSENSQIPDNKSNTDKYLPYAICSLIALDLLCRMIF